MTQPTHIPNKILPLDVFELQHDDFYRFIERHCGPLQAEILQFQLISDADIFIECQDPTEIMQYKSDKLTQLKQQSCLLTADGSAIVLPGIAASFQTLRKRLEERADKDFKASKRKRNISHTLASSPSLDNSQTKSFDDLRKHINESVNNWLADRRDEIGLQGDETLTESTDYNIEFLRTIDSRHNAVITCSCGSKSTLTRPSEYSNFQLSNFYRHLEHGRCSTIVKKLNNDSATTTDDGVSQPNASAGNQISQSAIVPSPSIRTNEALAEGSQRKRPHPVVGKPRRRRAKRQKRSS